MADLRDDYSVDLFKYRNVLSAFDAVVCDSIAISQAASNIVVRPHIGYATRVFTRMCAHAVCAIRAAPKSRWSKSDWDNWDFSSIASHARAIMEGYVLFRYLMREPISESEWPARLTVIHLHDCENRIRLFNDADINDQVTAFKKEADGLRLKLAGNIWFSCLTEKVRRDATSGRNMFIEQPNELLSEFNIDKKEYYVNFRLLSHYTHILPMSFYRMEQNGKNTGVENISDRSYIALGLEIGTNFLRDANDVMEVAFPHSAKVRRGVRSRFSPGPKDNSTARDQR